MRIAIMGAGFVGESLGKALVRAGHEIMWSSREPTSEKMKALVDSVGTNAACGTIQETLAYSDLVAIALTWDTIPEVAANAGDWAGKIVLDMTQGESARLAEITSRRVIKIFNSIGAEHYQDPLFKGLAASMFYCGDDSEAKSIAAGLARDLGFEPVDAGGLHMDRFLVNLAMLWINLSRGNLGRDFAFKLIEKPGAWPPGVDLRDDRK